MIVVDLCWCLLFCYALAPLYSCFLFLLCPIYSFVLPVLACFIVNTTSLCLPAPCFLVPAHFHFCVVLSTWSSSARQRAAPSVPNTGLILLRTMLVLRKKSLQHWLPINLLYLYSTFQGSQSVVRLDKKNTFRFKKNKTY